MSTGSSSTNTGYTPGPGSATMEMTLSLTDTTETMQSPQNVQNSESQKKILQVPAPTTPAPASMFQQPIIPFTPSLPLQQQDVITNQAKNQLESPSRNEIVPQQSPYSTFPTSISLPASTYLPPIEQKIKPYPIGTSVFDNIEVAPYNLMPSEMVNFLIIYNLQSSF
jgi:hypothetical protein